MKRLLLMMMALFAAATSDASGQTPSFNDVVFATGALDAGGSVPLRLDIYKPAGVTQPTPLVVWIHWGGWESGSYNTDVPTWVKPLLNRGISIASVEHRLSSQAIFPAQIQDVKGAVRFLRANASSYGIDPLRIGAWGNSSGGHLAALLATSGGVTAAEGTVGGNTNQSSRVMVAADFYGPTDILNLAPDVTTPPGSYHSLDSANSPSSRLIGFAGAGQGIGVLRANRNNPAAPYPQKMALVNLANPITHISPDDPPIYIAHGTNDNIVPIKQSQRLYDALTAAGLKTTYAIVPNGIHDDLGAATDTAAINFLSTELKRTFGDANRDNRCDIQDLYSLATHWQQPGGWVHGDFNSDGWIDAVDLGLLAANWQSTVSLAEAMTSVGFTDVPEPSSIAFLSTGVAFAALARRRR